MVGATRRIIDIPRFSRWWRPWDIRGTLRVSDLSGLHELTPELAKRLSDFELHLFPHVRSNDAVARSVVDAEIRRREAATARLALAVSVIAVAISFASLLAG